MTAGAASNSVCPSGWKLPVNSYDNNGSYIYVIRTAYDLLKKVDGVPTSGDGNAAASIAMRKFPLSFTFGGVYNADGEMNIDGGVQYYSATAFANAYANGLYFDGHLVYPEGAVNKASSGFIRCVMR